MALERLDKHTGKYLKRLVSCTKGMEMVRFIVMMILSGDYLFARTKGRT